MFPIVNKKIGKNTSNKQSINHFVARKPELLYLDSDLGQVDLHGQFFSAVHIRVMRLLECPLKLMQLVGGEGGAVSKNLVLEF